MATNTKQWAGIGRGGADRDRRATGAGSTVPAAVRIRMRDHPAKHQPIVGSTRLG